MDLNYKTSELNGDQVHITLTETAPAEEKYLVEDYMPSTFSDIMSDVV